MKTKEEKKTQSSENLPKLTELKYKVKNLRQQNNFRITSQNQADKLKAKKNFKYKQKSGLSCYS